jgi:hypothetical protein
MTPQRGSAESPRWVLHPVLIAAAFVLEVVLANRVEPPGFVRSLAVAVAEPSCSPSWPGARPGTGGWEA